MFNKVLLGALLNCAGAKLLEVNGIGNIVIISHEVCGGDGDMGEVGEAEYLDIIAVGSRVRPSSSHGRYDQ